jgi:hypothetical protein
MTKISALFVTSSAWMSISVNQKANVKSIPKSGLRLRRIVWLMTSMMGYSTVRSVESFCVNPRRVQTVAAIIVQTVLYII